MRKKAIWIIIGLMTAALVGIITLQVNWIRNTIKVNGKPSWGEHCTQCLACINLCPVKAIQCGKGTQSKGRYKNPNINVNEMKINIPL